MIPAGGGPYLYFSRGEWCTITAATTRVDGAELRYKRAHARSEVRGRWSRGCASLCACYPAPQPCQGGGGGQTQKAQPIPAAAPNRKPQSPAAAPAAAPKTHNPARRSARETPKSTCSGSTAGPIPEIPNPRSSRETLPTHPICSPLRPGASEHMGCLRAESQLCTAAAGATFGVSIHVTAFATSHSKLRLHRGRLIQ